MTEDVANGQQEEPAIQDADSKCHSLMVKI